MTDFVKELAGLSEELGQKLPQEALDAVRKSCLELKDTGIEQRALAVGDKAPDFELPNIRGSTTKLSALLAQGPVVLVFYRGGWCPYCNLHLAHFQQLLPEFTQAGAKLVAISPQKNDKSISVAEGKNLQFEVVSDEEAKVAEAFGVLFQLDEGIEQAYRKLGLNLDEWNPEAVAWKLPLPATYIIAKDGTIKYANMDAVYANRSDPNEVLAEVKRL